MINRIIQKIKSFRKPDPSELVGKLIQADEICKLEPALVSEFKMSYTEYRLALQKERNFDIANEIAQTVAIGELTVEQHARKIVNTYYNSQKLNPWYYSILPSAKEASTRAHQAYGN